MGSGSLAVCLGTPFDVALVRMQADSMKATTERRGYKNVFDALIRVAKEEGFSKLYRYSVNFHIFLNPRKYSECFHVVCLESWGNSCTCF